MECWKFAFSCVMFMVCLDCSFGTFFTAECGSERNLMLGLGSITIYSPDRKLDGGPCTYRINGNVGEILLVEFVYFNVGVVTPGSVDYLTIDDGSLVHKYSGALSNTVRRFHNSTILISLTWTSGRKDNRYKLVVSAAESPCSSLIIDHNEGEVVSPGYPTMPYGQNSYCTWFIKTVPFFKINFTCTDFVVQADGPQCTEDYLAVSLTGDLQLKDSTRYCGTKGPLQLTSKGSYLSIVFRSGPRSAGAKGFKCSYSSFVLDPRVRWPSWPWSWQFPSWPLNLPRW